MDNQSLYKYCLQDTFSTSYGDINSIVAQVASFANFYSTPRIIDMASLNSLVSKENMRLITPGIAEGGINDKLSLANKCRQGNNRLVCGDSDNTIVSNYSLECNNRPAFTEDGLNLNNSACITLDNSPSIAKSLKNINDKFDTLYRLRAYVHWYVGEGMEEAELSEAREKMEGVYKNYNVESLA